MTQTARAVLQMDSTRISEAVAPREGNRPRLREWPESRIRTGIVVGSIQSGKTGSMLALSSMLLDSGVGVLIILAGTRVPLWLQTYERLLTQLDGSTRQSAWKRNQERVLVPEPEDILGEEGRADPRRYLRRHRRRIEQMVPQAKPLIFVIPKEDSHLLELGRMLREVLSKEVLEARGCPLEMVVLDDEADDASVLDATAAEKVTPRFIQQLWSSPQSPDTTWHEYFYATYVAYTATPQANFLQSTHNPLSPRHFLFALRTPDDVGELEPSSLTYTEKEGVHRYYMGGRMFYERFHGRSGELCSATPFPIRMSGESEAIYEARFRRLRWKMLGDALRSYFVGGALRLYLSGRRLSTIQTQEARPLEDLVRLLPSTHCMLYHPSVLRDLHFEGAEHIARWSAAAPDQEDNAEVIRDSEGNAVLNSEGLERRLTTEEDAWRAWLARFDDTTAEVQLLPKATYSTLREIPWEAIRKLLVEEVFPFVKLRVLNSDPRANDRPLFAPQESVEMPGHFTPPPELYSIFVAGNILSRGLTIEGLSTSLFLRSSKDPAADTQMQMQRWFGYRGDHLPFCRVFLFSDQLELFRAYHVNDEALKLEILRQNQRSVQRSGVLVLQGQRFSATGKVDSRRVPLNPGPTPAIRLVEHQDSSFIQSNLDVVARFFDQHPAKLIEVPAGQPRGLLTSATFDFAEIAALLESLRYTQHAPDPRHELYARWISLGTMLGVSQPLLRLPGDRQIPLTIEPSACPYSIAAYLRLWATLLQNREARGLYPTDRPGLSWHMLDHEAYRASQPRFYVGIRFGSEGTALDARLAHHGVRVMRRGLSNRPFVLETLWGSRGTESSYLGDQFFDYHHHMSQPLPRLHENSLWRRRGHPGLLLFHIVRHPDKPVDMVAAGLALPHGGPDHIAALRGPLESIR